jgi:hypothetical protein
VLPRPRIAPLSEQPGRIEHAANVANLARLMEVRSAAEAAQAA